MIPCCCVVREKPLISRTITALHWLKVSSMFWAISARRSGKLIMSLSSRLNDCRELICSVDFSSSKDVSFIFLCAGYSTHKRFVLGGEECAAPFVGNTLVSCNTLV